MWISQKIAASGSEKPTVSIGQVTGGQESQVSVQADSEYRQVPLCAPWGIAYLPPVGEQAVLLHGSGEPLCAGVIPPAMDLQPGELVLFSAGGATICLKNSGEVLINGQSFPKQGDA